MKRISDSSTPGLRDSLHERRDAGFSQIEIVLAVFILVVAAIGTMQLSLASVSLEAQNRERALATQVLRDVVEDMRATPFDELFVRFNADATDNPVAGTSLGNAWTVNQESEALGTIACNVNVTFPTNEAGVLSEEVPQIATGFPTDLNVNGETTVDGELGSYKVLPTLITVSWTSTDGEEQSFNLPMIFSRTGNDGLKN